MSSTLKPMTLGRALTLIGGLGAAGTAIGSGIGYAMGLYAPGLYIAWFPSAAKRPDFNPVQIGASLGTAQGLAVGLVIGLAIAGLLTWQYIRAAQPQRY